MYCTIDEIKVRRIPEQDLLGLTDDADTGVVDESVVNEVIAEADELIDGHLRNRYTLPLASVPGLITSLSIDITAYKLYGRRTEIETPERIVEDYKMAMRQLANIRDGKLSLGVTDADGDDDNTPSSITVSSRTKQFDSDTLDKY